MSERPAVPSDDLTGRVAVVTGAAGGSGGAVAAALATAGAALALVGRRIDRLEALAERLGLDPDAWLAVGADLRSASEARAAVDAVVERFGRVDVLIHLVGGWTGGTSTIETPDEAFRGMLDQHLWTTLHVVRAVAPVMVAGGSGRIVVVSSSVTVETPARQSAYAVGKAAEEALTGTLAHELVGTGVTANVLRVRAIDTDGVRDREPSPRTAAWTTPDELASAVVYLCSSGAGVVNGARIPLHPR